MTKLGPIDPAADPSSRRRISTALAALRGAVLRGAVLVCTVLLSVALAGHAVADDDGSGAAPADTLPAEPLVWAQQELWQGSYPSMKSETRDVELADDFYLVGDVTVVEVGGSPQATAPQPGSLEAVELRIYDVAADGGPGQVQAEYVFEAGDPAFLTDVEPAAYTVRLRLPEPFAATGWHFLGVQLVDSDGWSRGNANSTAERFVRGSYAWIKDNLGDGVWKPFQPIPSRPRFDLQTRLFGVLGAPAQIDELDAPTLTRSGRLLVGGLNMGAEQDGGEVLIGGQSALVTEWTDRYLHVYVPETATLGENDVVVVTSAGASPPAPLTVTERRPQGQVRWSFTCDSAYSRHRVAVGPGGEIYFQTVDGRVYALAPDGALLWIRQLEGQGDEGPIAVGADGTLFLSVNPLGPDTLIQALRPSDGAILWTFTATESQGLIAGVGLGPDGHVYAVFDNLSGDGHGAISLDAADGSLRWSYPGDPVFSEYGALGTELAFAEDRFYFGFDQGAVDPTSLLFAMDYDGDLLWSEPRPDNGAQPRVTPDGDVVVRAWGSASGQQMSRYAADGTIEWITDQSPAFLLSDPGVGPDGAVFVSRGLDDAWALEPDGETRWTTPIDEAVAIDDPSPTPDGRAVLFGGVEDTPSFYDNGLFVALDAETGDRLWTHRVPPEPDGARTSSSAAARFSADGQTAYFPLTRNFNTVYDERCYVFAVEVSSADALFSDDFESGDTGRWDG